MEKDIKDLLKENIKQLPILSGYWDIHIANEQKKETKESKIVSTVHNTSMYLPYSFYKPISTSIDLINFYE
jgi:hypothetical protein